MASWNNTIGITNWANRTNTQNSAITPQIQSTIKGNVALWANYPAINNILGITSNIEAFGFPTGKYKPLVDISSINNATVANLQVKQYIIDPVNSNYYGGYINADNGISTKYFSGNNADITDIGCASLTAGNPVTNLGVISAYGVNRPVGFNALYAQGGITLDGGGTVHGITIGTQPVSGVNTMRIDVLPVGIDIVAATYVTINAGGAGNFACGGALSLAGGSYIELNTANINCINTTSPGAGTLNVDNIFPSQNATGNLNNFNLYGIGQINFNPLGIINVDTINSSNIENTFNILTSSITTSNLLVNSYNNTSNNINSTYQYINPSTNYISSFRVTNTNSNLQVFQFNLVSNVIGYDNTTLMDLGGTNYYVFNALGSSYFSNAFSNSIASLGGAPALVQFGTSNGVGYADFYNEGSADPLYIEPDYPVSYTGFASVPAGANKRVLFDPSFVPAGIFLTDLPSILYPSTFYTSVYTVDTYLTQNLSSAILTVDISGYDTNNNIINGQGDFQINSSKFLTDKIYTNFISAGTIQGGIPFINSNIIVDSISTNRISTGVLQTNQIIFDNNGTAGLSTFSNFYRGYGGLLALSNVDFYLNKQDIVGASIGDFENVSTISTIAKVGIFSTLQVNNISAGNIIGGITQSNINSTIQGLGTLGYISSSQLTSTVKGLGQTYLSTPSLTSSITGLGTAGYISSSQLTSTVRGLGQIYISTPSLTSSIVGLGTAGYISSSQLTSTVRGLGQIYLSSVQGSIQTDITSTVTGLGTAGYISTPSLVSTIVGWAGIPANKNVDLYGNDIDNVNHLFVDTISPAHSDFVLFDGNGIQTNNITSADFTQINFNNDINLEQRYNIVDALSLTLSDGIHTTILSNDSNDGGVARFYTSENQFFFTTSNSASAVLTIDYSGIVDTFLSNDSAGNFHLSNGYNNIIFEGTTHQDYISANCNAGIAFNNYIDLQGYNIYDASLLGVDYLQTYNNGSITFNVPAYFNSNDLSGAKSFAFLGTNPIYPSGFIGNTNDIIVQNTIDMSNNSIINLFTTATDYITANSNVTISITSPLDLNYRNIYNVSNLTVDYLTNNSNSVIEVFSDFLIDGALSVVNITNGIGYVNFGNNNITDVAQIHVDFITANYNSAITSLNDLNMNYSNILNANTLTTSNISTIHISTSAIYTSSLTVSTINNTAFPLIQFGSGTNNNTITLPKHYANTNYQILLTQRGASAIIPLYSSNITTSNFYVGGSVGSYQFSWMTTGF